MGEEATETTRLADAPEAEEVSLLGVKLRYGGMMAVVFLVTVLFRSVPQMNDIFSKIPEMDGHCTPDNKLCLMTTVTLRFSFALFVFFCLHVLLSLKWMRLCFGSHAFDYLVRRGFIFKIVLLVGLCIGFLFIPYDFMTGYGYLAMAGSVIFLILQSILLIHLAYSWNDRWVPRDGWVDDDDGVMFKRATIGVTFIFFVFSCVLCGLMYKWFAPSTCSGSENSVHLFFITFTLIFGILLMLASAVVDGGSIFVSSFAFAYCSVMTFAALSSGAVHEDCNELYSDPAKVNTSTVVSLLIAAASVVHAAVSASGQRDALSITSIEEAQEGSEFPFFFTCFAMGACYMAMTLCSWEVPSSYSTIDHDAYVRSDTSAASMWIKMGTVWLTMILFTWALVAPRVCGEGGVCCQDRSFA